MPDLNINDNNEQPQQYIIWQPRTRLQRLIVAEAESFMAQIRLVFRNQPRVYNDFLDIMADYKSKKTNESRVIAQVAILFKGHPELICGFAKFLPAGYNVEITNNLNGYHVHVSYNPEIRPSRQ